MTYRDSPRASATPTHRSLLPPDRMPPGCQGTRGYSLGGSALPTHRAGRVNAVSSAGTRGVAQRSMVRSLSLDMGEGVVMAKARSAISRSPEMWLVAYYLARFGRPGQLPPASLQTDSWAEAYDLFFPALGDGREAAAFRNSLKNARDAFDAHVGTERVGWRDAKKAERPPGTLGAEATRILDQYRESSHEDVWQAIHAFVAAKSLSRTDSPKRTAAAGHGATSPSTELTLNDVLVPPPAPAPELRAGKTGVAAPAIRPVNDKEIKELGLAGERWVLELERQRLQAAGRSDLANKIIHSSVEQGDGLGYDILSWEADGQPRYIEVKTTRRDVRADFVITANEVDASSRNGERHHLYRVFNWSARPGVYILSGDLTNRLNLKPISWRAIPK